QEWRQLQTLFDGRRRGPKTRKPRSYLLTNLALCGKCNQPLRASFKNNRNNWRYMCRKIPGHGNCGSLSVVGEPVEQAVWETMCRAVDVGFIVLPPLRPWHRSAFLLELSTQLDGHQHKLDQLAEAHFLEGRMSEGAYKRITDEITEQMQIIKSEI